MAEMPYCRALRLFYMVTNILSFVAFLLVCGDRCFAVYFPFKSKSLGNKSAINVCIFSLVITVLLVLPGIFLGNFIGKCWVEEEYPMYELFLVLLRFGVFEMILVIIINVALLYKIRHLVRERQKLQEGKTSDKSEVAQEIKSVICILILSVILIICTFPMCAMQIIGVNAMGLQAFTHVYSQRHSYNFGDIFNIFYFVQESINWIVYLIFNSNFRQEFSRMFRIFN